MVKNIVRTAMSHRQQSARAERSASVCAGLLVAALIASSCDASPVEIFDSQSQTTVVKRGQEVRIRLQTIGPGEYVSPPFVSGAAVRFTGMADVLDFAVPAGATQEFRFRAVAYGRAVVTFVNTHNSRTVADTIRVR